MSTENTETKVIPAFLREENDDDTVAVETSKNNDNTDTNPIKNDKEVQEMSAAIRAAQGKAPAPVSATPEPTIQDQPERERILDDASEIMTNRNATHGAAVKNFKRIAQLWSVVFDREVTLEEVALCMDLLKTARILETPSHRDSWVDKVGYSAVGGEIAVTEA